MEGQIPVMGQMHSIQSEAAPIISLMHSNSSSGATSVQAAAAATRPAEHSRVFKKPQSSLGEEMLLQKACRANSKELATLCIVLHASSDPVVPGKQTSFWAISWKKQYWLSAEEQDDKSVNSCLSQSVGASEILINFWS